MCTFFFFYIKLKTSQNKKQNVVVVLDLGEMSFQTQVITAKRATVEVEAWVGYLLQATAFPSLGCLTRAEFLALVLRFRYGLAQLNLKGSR